MLLLLAPFATEELLKQNPVPLAVMAGVIVWCLHVIEIFRRVKLETNGDADASVQNIAELLSYHMTLHLSTKEAATSKSLLLAAAESQRGLFVLHHIGIDVSDIESALLKTPITEPLETCLQWGLDAMKDLGTRRLDSTAMIYAYLTNVQALKVLVEHADLSMEDVKNVLKAEAFHYEVNERQNHPLSPASLVKILGSIGRTWVIGYNNDLERLTTNISGHILSYERSIIIHKDILASLEKMLGAGSQANILLLGNGGTGKRTLVRNFAYWLRNKQMTSALAFTDVLQLKTAVLLSGSGQSDAALLHALSNTKEGGNFILVIENIALLLKAADARLKEILVNILQAKNIRTICIADTADYHSLIKTDPLLDQLLQKAFVEDVSDDEAMKVLLEEYFTLERRLRVRITYKALKSLLLLSKRFIGKGGLPGKAVDVLREAVTSLSSGGGKIVTDEHIRAVISRRTRIDVAALGQNERDKLLHLKEHLQAHIIGQQQAIDSLVAALKRGRLNVGSAARPIGTFLFLGTTGLGKTETAKALAQEYFGSAERMIRVDLNEYSDEASIRLLIGGQGEHGFTEGFLTKKVQDEPFSLVLLDEIEKAHPKILNLFLQILDEGTLIGGDGVKTDFKNTIIIATSNAGSHWMTEHAIPSDSSARETFRAALVETIVGERTFSPEFVNRFDEVIVFSPPSRDDVRQLAILMLDQVIQRFVSEKGIRITVESAVVDFLAEKGFSTEFGAREMRRTITQSIENFLADYLLSHTVGRGDTILIQMQDLQK